MKQWREMRHCQRLNQILMSIKTQRLDNKVFSMASTLFGFGENKALGVQRESIEKPLQFSGRIIAIYPAIIEEAFSSTMDNYRKYIASYNF